MGVFKDFEITKLTSVKKCSKNGCNKIARFAFKVEQDNTENKEHKKTKEIKTLEKTNFYLCDDCLQKLKQKLTENTKKP